MRYISPIDVHTHLRGTEYSTDYMAYAAEDAKAVGLCAVMEMPNPQPWITSNPVVRERNERWRVGLRHIHDGNIYHYCHVGMTNDPVQVKDALSDARDQIGGMISSDKIFYTHSTGNMGVLDHNYQKWLWQKKFELNYKGVSMGHFEDEACFGSSGIKFDSNDPCSHSLYQGPDAETVQVERQLGSALAFGFAGTFYICHVSNPETVRLVKEFRRKFGPNGFNTCRFDIVLEITWHHMLLNFSDYARLGNFLKCNPPVRSPRMQEELLDMVLTGQFDVIGSDHAPHPLERKQDKEKPASGVPALPFWPKGIQILKQHGISETLLENLIFRNANRTFELNLPEKYVEKTDTDIILAANLFTKYGGKGYSGNPFWRLYLS